MSTLSQLKDLLAEELGEPEWTYAPDKSFRVDLNVDNLKLLQIILSVEDEFGIDVPEADVASLTTIESLVNVIDLLLEAKAGGLS